MDGADSLRFFAFFFWKVTKEVSLQKSLSSKMVIITAFTTLIFIHFLEVVTSQSSCDEDNEYFCQLCTVPCISCGNGIGSYFKEANCKICSCEFAWWWIPGVK